MIITEEIHVLPAEPNGDRYTQHKLSTASPTQRVRTLTGPLVAVTLGIGQLNWNRRERVSDRYGTVGLYVNAHWQAGQDSIDLHKQLLTEGTYGQLHATVLETRDADHIGDFTHGWHVGGAIVGDMYVLGEGELFFESDLGDKVGLRPRANLNAPWLDGPTLYRCHSQTVRLDFAFQRA